jgi:hypothetical protein
VRANSSAWGRRRSPEWKRAPPRGATATGHAGRHSVVLDENGGERSRSLHSPSLHNWEHSFCLFPWMQARGYLLHNPNLHKALYRLPNSSGLHSISLDRVYAGCQSPSWRIDTREKIKFAFGMIHGFSTFNVDRMEQRRRWR